MLLFLLTIAKLLETLSLSMPRKLELVCMSVFPIHSEIPKIQEFALSGALIYCIVASTLHPPQLKLISLCGH